MSEERVATSLKDIQKRGLDRLVDLPLLANAGADVGSVFRDALWARSRIFAGLLAFLSRILNFGIFPAVEA